MPSTAQLEPFSAIFSPTMWWLPVPKWKTVASLAFFSTMYSTKCRSQGHCASSRLQVSFQ